MDIIVRILQRIILELRNWTHVVIIWKFVLLLFMERLIVFIFCFYEPRYKCGCTWEAYPIRSFRRFALRAYRASIVNRGRSFFFYRTPQTSCRDYVREDRFSRHLFHEVCPLHWVQPDFVHKDSFSMGKTTCMSVDFGASGIRIVPVYDGYSMMSCLFWLTVSCVASVVSPYGGDYMNSLLNDKLISLKIQVTPHCFLKKQVVGGVVADIKKIDYPNTRASFIRYAVMVVFTTCCNVEYYPWYERMLLPSLTQAIETSVREWNASWLVPLPQPLYRIHYLIIWKSI